MTGSESMVTLQERLVNLINQLSMPVLETSLVISRWTNRLLQQLQQHTTELPENLAKPWPLSVEPVVSDKTFDLDKALSLVDRDRVDILDTLIRVTLEEEDDTKRCIRRYAFMGAPDTWAVISGFRTRSIIQSY